MTMGPVESLVLRAWGLGTRIRESETGTQGEQSRSLKEVLEQARELDAKRIAEESERGTEQEKRRERVLSVAATLYVAWSRGRLDITRDGRNGVMWTELELALREAGEVDTPHASETAGRTT